MYHQVYGRTRRILGKALQYFKVTFLQFSKENPEGNIVLHRSHTAGIKVICFTTLTSVVFDIFFYIMIYNFQFAYL